MEVYAYEVFGEKIALQENSFTLAPAETKPFTLDFPEEIVDIPGNHTLAISLVNKDGAQVSLPLLWKLDVPGAAADITHLRLDQPEYAAGKTARVEYLGNIRPASYEKIDTYTLDISLKDSNDQLLSLIHIYLPREMLGVLLFLLLVLLIYIQEEMETLVTGVVAAGVPIVGITVVSKVNMTVMATAVFLMWLSEEHVIAAERISVIPPEPAQFAQRALLMVVLVLKTTAVIPPMEHGTAAEPYAALPSQPLVV